LIHAIVHAADIQDRDGGAFVMATMFGMYPFLMKLYADGGYQGPLFRRCCRRCKSALFCRHMGTAKRRQDAVGTDSCGMCSVEVSWLRRPSLSRASVDA